MDTFSIVLLISVIVAILVKLYLEYANLEKTVVSKTTTDARERAFQLVDELGKTLGKTGPLQITLGFIIIIFIVAIALIFHNLGLQEESCKKLDITYKTLTNETYFRVSTVKQIDIFDASNSTLINYHVKSAYNCCCGGEYRNNFVALCALEKCISNGCRFLDFEIYSYNNDPIVASSTANSNYIKETYNALLLTEVLTTITDNAFDGTKTLCSNDPLILNFRIMSTNLTMLENMGTIFEEYLDKSINSDFTLMLEKDASVLSVKMKDLYRKMIIICDFNPNPNIILNPKLLKLKNYTNLRGNSLSCNTYRYNDITIKDALQLIEHTKKKFTIVLPNLDNSIKNFDPVSCFVNGCQAICMKHQNLDSNLTGYNDEFTLAGNFSWKMKETRLLNIPPESLQITSQVGLNNYSPQNITSSLTNQFNRG